MTALVLDFWSRALRAILAESQTWACDQCGTVNSNSVTTCYKCGA